MSATREQHNVVPVLIAPDRLRGGSRGDDVVLRKPPNATSDFHLEVARG
jgi:hypothetical protein